MQLRELMKSDLEVITPDCTIAEAAQKMKEVNAGILPVVEGSKNKPSSQPIGVVTDRDIVIRCIARGCDPTSTSVSEAFTEDTVFGFVDDNEEQAFKKMRDHHVGRLLVKDEQGKLCGIVSMADIISKTPNSIWDDLHASAANTNRESTMKKRAG